MSRYRFNLPMNGDRRWMIGDWQECTPCVPGCEKRRAVKCIRPVGHAEQDVDIIADSYCQGPKPKEQESCTGRRRRDDVLARQSNNKSINHAGFICFYVLCSMFISILSLLSTVK